MLLVPATMELLGDRNWWLPGWLDRGLPNVHVDCHEVTDDEYDLRDAIGRQRAPADVPTQLGVRSPGGTGESVWCVVRTPIP